MTTKLDSAVKCRTCGSGCSVDFAECLRGGWPKCCGATMELVKQPKDVGEATRRALTLQMPPGLLRRTQETSKEAK